MSVADGSTSSYFVSSVRSNNETKTTKRVITRSSSLIASEESKMKKPKTKYESRSRHGVIQSINFKIKNLDWIQVKESLKNEQPFFLCDAPLEEWNYYVESESQQFKSKFMMWLDGKIYIEDLPSDTHESFSRLFDRAMSVATGTDFQHLMAFGDAYVQIANPQLEPDCAFGPDRTMGIAPPQGFRWKEYHTLKVEIGVHQPWQRLDYKANQWRIYPGLQYIVCIHVSPDENVASYKFYDIANAVNYVAVPPVPLLPNVAAMPILAAPGNTTLSFDAHRLLGLAPGAVLPVGFNNPVTISLTNIVARL